MGEHLFRREVLKAALSFACVRSARASYLPNEWGSNPGTQLLLSKSHFDFLAGAVVDLIGWGVRGVLRFEPQMPQSAP